jgi:hypothetical protein
MFKKPKPQTQVSIQKNVYRVEFEGHWVQRPWTKENVLRTSIFFFGRVACYSHIEG